MGKANIIFQDTKVGFEADVKKRERIIFMMAKLVGK